MKRILVLYRELAGYFVNCLNHLCDEYGVEADVVAYPLSADAPFQFNFSPRITCHDRMQMDEARLHKLCSLKSFDMIFCGGWSDKDYLKTVRMHKEIPSLLGFDNQWEGSAKQWAAAIYARLSLVKDFNMAFVPGIEQAEYASRMGFQKIVQGAYCCDIDKFAHIHKARRADHWSKQEKTLFFVGRYAKEKFVLELQRAFITIVEQYQLPWRLICAGTGPLWEERVIHARIEHLGFLQPQDLLDQMALGHAFILPSVFEPWGVVVHEFAAAGLPLILSDKVGARTAFLNEPKNGFSFTSGSELELKSALEKLMRTSNGHLFDMSQQSYYLAQSITPDTWSKGVLTLLEP